MNDETAIGHEGEEFGRLRDGSGFVPAELGTAAVAELRPETVHDEAVVTRASAFGATAMVVAVFGRPGKREAVVVEIAGRGTALRGQGAGAEKGEE